MVDGTTDLAISVFPDMDDDIHRDELLAESYVIALRPGHPAIPGFGLDAWLAWPHILVSGRGEARSPLDAELARLGRARRVGLVVPSFGLVPDVLRGSDMIAMLPSRVMAAAGDLVTLPTQSQSPAFPSISPGTADVQRIAPCGMPRGYWLDCRRFTTYRPLAHRPNRESIKNTIPDEGHRPDPLPRRLTGTFRDAPLRQSARDGTAIDRCPALHR